MQLVLSTGTTDIDPPSLAIIVPSVPVLNEPISLITVTDADTGSGIDLTALRILRDGVDITAACFVWATMASCEEIGFQDGQHSIAVSIRDMAGNIATTSTQVMQDARPPLLSIDTPVDIDNITGQETGVIVNGVVALVYEGRFAANHVPLEEGENVITVVATDSAGHTETTAITLYRDTSEGYVRLTADTSTGLAPFETVLRLDGPVDDTASSITVTDAVNAQVLATISETEYIVRLSAPGLYVLTAEATDYAANIYAYTVAIQVADRTALDTVLQAK